MMPLLPYIKRCLPAVLILLLWTGGPAFAKAQNPQLIFDKANDHLQKNQFRQALSLYHALEDTNKVSGALFLNMGISYIRIDSMGKAKYYFLRADRFEETRQQAQQGLRYVESRFSHQSALLPVLPWERALNWLQRHLGYLTILAIGLILFNLGIFLYISRWFREGTRFLFSKTAVGVISAGCLIILLSFYEHYRQQRYRQAVMVKQEANVMKQPARDATVVNQAYEGYSLAVDRRKSREHPAWSYIRMSNGQYGWIPTKEIMIL